MIKFNESMYFFFFFILALCSIFIWGLASQSSWVTPGAFVTNRLHSSYLFGWSQSKSAGNAQSSVGGLNFKHQVNSMTLLGAQFSQPFAFVLIIVLAERPLRTREIANAVHISIERNFHILHEILGTKSFLQDGCRVC